MYSLINATREVAMVKVGAVLMVGGLAALVGYAVYLLFRALFLEDVSLIVQIAVPAALVGLALLMIAVVRDRLRKRRGEQFKEVNF